MKLLPPDELERQRKLAESVECVLEDDVCLLGDVEPGTTSAWRKRGEGPPYLRFGKTFLYPVRELADHLRQRIRIRGEMPVKDAL